MRAWVDLLVAVTLVMPLCASAVTIRVPDEFPLIGAAVQAAASGDTVLVSPGTYLECNISFGGKNIVVRSSAGASETIVSPSSGGYTDRGFVINSGETADAVLDGFTVFGGEAPFGGGLSVNHASPTILNCRFERCVARDVVMGGVGGGAGFEDSEAVVRGCTFFQNSSLGQGGGVAITWGSRVTLEGCEFIGMTCPL